MKGENPHKTQTQTFMHKCLREQYKQSKNNKNEKYTFNSWITYNIQYGKWTRSNYRFCTQRWR